MEYTATELAEITPPNLLALLNTKQVDKMLARTIRRLAARYNAAKPLEFIRSLIPDYYHSSDGRYGTHNWEDHVAQYFPGNRKAAKYVAGAIGHLWVDNGYPQRLAARRKK